ncbi:hypothetical protein BDV96DRAFT_490101, partial [Lophiotrema nucula]
PAFFLKGSPDGVKHYESFYFTQHGTEPDATYALKHLDPASNEAKNTYAAALFDSHSPEILYGEVLSKPGWTHPTLSQDEIRRNGGVPPPPQPIYPTEFAIQLYNPDQQILVKQQTSKWSGTVTYEFSMPQTTFRTPSISSLDRSQGDPGADAAVPRINFLWKKEGRIGRDMTCYLTGKSTDPTGKKAKKSKEPDIALALFSGLKEITIMESHLYRVEMEDYKGLEVVLLLSAAVIKDMFYGNQRDVFHIIDPNARKNSGGLRGRKGSSPLAAPNATPPVMTPQPQRSMQPPKAVAISGLYNQPSPNAAKRTSLPPLQTVNQRLDPRAQWEIDAETARLKAQVDAEAREQKRQEDVARKARRKAEAEELRKTQNFLEQEERARRHQEAERRRKQQAVDQETERLRRNSAAYATLSSTGSVPAAPWWPSSCSISELFLQQRVTEANRATQTKEEELLEFEERERGQSDHSQEKAKQHVLGLLCRMSRGEAGAIKSAGVQCGVLLVLKLSSWTRQIFPTYNHATYKPLPSYTTPYTLQLSLLKITEAKMFSKSFVAVLSFLGSATAHFALDYPYWRGDSFAEGRSQWDFPCANVTETTDLSNRTQWPATGGSILLHAHHPWALTYVNLGLGTNVSSFNISLVSSFNQTGNGTFCLKETGKAALEADLAKAGLNTSSLEGTQASLQVIQITSSGASLYNCADITFNSSAALLADSECTNSTGVGGVAIQNADATTSVSPTPSSTGAAVVLKPAMAGSLLAGVVAIMGALM